MQGKREWLFNELNGWVGHGLISAEQGAAIRSRYPAAGAGLAFSLFTAIGAVLVGLGVILFFAWNWDALHRVVKLGLLFMLLLGAHAGGQWQLARGQHASGEALALLGSLLFGAGLWLISQIYHIDEHMPNAFLAWGVAALALGLAMRSPWQGLLAAALLISWGCMEAFGYDNPTWWAVTMLLFLIAQAVWLRSRLLLTVAVSGFLLMLVLNGQHRSSDVAFQLAYAAAIVCIAVSICFGRLPDATMARLRIGFALPGYAIALAFAFALTFKTRQWQPPVAGLFGEAEWAVLLWGWVPLLLVVVAAALAWMPWRVWRDPDPWDSVQLGLVALGLLLYLLPLHGQPLASAAVMNLVVLGQGLLFILVGSRVQRGGVVAIGCLIVAALVFARYNDLFQSLLARSAAFLLLGVALFAVGQYYARQRRLQVAS